MCNDDNEWGNMELPGLSHDEIMDPLINVRLGNTARAKTKQWQNTKQKISNAKKGQASHMKGKVGASKGKTYTAEHRKNISESLKGSKHPSSRKIRTPLGVFDSLREAYEAHGWKSNNPIFKRLREQPDEYYYYEV